MVEFNDRADEGAELYHAHNLLLNTTLGVGVLGGVLLLAMFASQFLALVYHPSMLPDVVFALIAVNSLSEVALFHSFADAAIVLWMMALLWRRVDASLARSTVRLVSEEN